MQTDVTQTNASPSKQNEIVVFILRTEAKCAECNKELFKGNFLRVENDRPLCMDCADLGRLEYLPRGDTAITRRATKHSPLRAVVVQWSRTRKRYERQGILASPAAIRQAEEECLADADLRLRRRDVAAERRDVDDQEYIATVAQEIKRLYPACPEGESEAIAAHACLKNSGRVGRCAAAKELDPGALRAAVVAHIRHVHTGYDNILGMFGNRAHARAQVSAKIDRVLAEWKAGNS
jgi:hypothetical protein